jgi:diguanylate cyclase (GGDEF)-like protein/PAS domain S-box-containing protein
MSGVEYDANVLQAILDGRWVEPLGPWQRALLTTLVVLLPLLAYRRLEARATLLVVLLAAAATLLLAHLLLGMAGLWFAPAAALVGLVVGQLLWSWRRLEHHRRALAVQMETDRATLDSVGDAVVRTDRAGRVRFMNAVAQRLGSQSGEEAIGRPFSEVFVPDSEDDRKRIEATIGGASEAAGGARTAQCSLRDRDGHRRTVQLTASFVHGAPGDDAGLVLAMSDVTAVVSLSEALAHQAMHDDLTRLPNRRLLLDRVEQALRLAARTQERVAVLFVDLDGFKRINDSLGHAAGDRVLQEVARRLAATRRGGDTVARWGGDEFVVVLEGLGRDASVGAIARKVLAALSAPLACDDKEIIVTASIGIAIHPGDGDEAGLLLRHADMALYGAKRQGRGRIRFHSEKAQESTARHFALEQELRHAVRRAELELFYQPQLHCATGRVVGVEALIRWHHPQRGLLAPGAFIPVAEETGLIDEIGTWTLGEACRQAQRWAALGLTDITIAVNLSPRQIQRANIARSLERVLRESGVAATTIKLEIVETAVVHDLDRLEGALRAVRALGVHVAIDDFGTGYSSLIHLKRFPVDEVKIDQSFVRGIGDDTNDAAITAGVIAMAHSLGLRVVAEGVESEAQLGFLRERECDEWQGYLCSRPLPAVELTRYLEAGQATPAPAQEGG